MKRLSCIKSILAVIFVLAMLCSSAAADTVVYDLDDFTIEIDERISIFNSQKMENDRLSVIINCSGGCSWVMK